MSDSMNRIYAANAAKDNEATSKKKPVRESSRANTRFTEDSIMDWMANLGGSNNGLNAAVSPVIPSIAATSVNTGEPLIPDRSFMMPQDTIRNPNGYASAQESIPTAAPIQRQPVRNQVAVPTAQSVYPAQVTERIPLAKQGMTMPLQREPLTAMNIMNTDIGSDGRGVNW